MASMAHTPRFIEFSGTTEELSLELFCTAPHVLLGGSPISCAAPPQGSVVDVSLPTMYGSNVSRFHLRAAIEHLGRSLDDIQTPLYAIWSCEGGFGFHDEGLAQAMRAAEARIRRENDNAATIAHFLACHPAVAAVRYPGIKADPCFGVSTQILAHGFGNTVDYLPVGTGGYERVYAGEADPLAQAEALEAHLAGALGPSSP